MAWRRMVVVRTGLTSDVLPWRQMGSRGSAVSQPRKRFLSPEQV